MERSRNPVNPRYLGFELWRGDRIWMGVLSATRLAARREPKATEAIKEALVRFFAALRTDPSYGPLDPDSWCWEGSNRPLATYLWALVRIEGIDGHDWVKQQLALMEAESPECANEILGFTATLCWAGYETHPADESWRWPKPTAFDADWVTRFVRAAREQGYHMNTSDKEALLSDLTTIIQDFDAIRNNPVEARNLRRFWLAASASIVLCEIKGETVSRRIFPFGTSVYQRLLDPTVASRASQPEKEQGGKGDRRQI
jgi:hypothetical protein